MSITSHLMTAEELIRLPSGRHRYELVKGELLTMSPSGGEHGFIVINLSAPLAIFVRTNRLGFVFGAETGFWMEHAPDTVLAPDISFIRGDRLETVSTGYLEIVPDLVVEVISPSESKRKVEKKTAQWLDFGVREVWLVQPSTRTVEVRTINESKTLSENDDLSADNIVPGFRILVREIFE